MKTTWLEIDLKQIRNNLMAVRDFVSMEKKIIVVIKTNAYGHGLLEVAKTISSMNVEYFGVVTIDEAKTLRENGIKTPILLLSPFNIDDIEYAVENNITLSVTDNNFPENFSNEKIFLNKKLKLHIQVNSGMNRHGVSKYRLNSIYHYIMRDDNLKLTGIYSNSSAVSTVKDEFSYFIQSITSIEKFSDDILCHFGNSASLLSHPQTILDGTRFGILLFGIYPHDNVPEILNIKPTISWRTVINSIRKIKKGENIGYLGKFYAKKDMKIAIISSGYGYGYSRLFYKNGGEVLINGKRAKLIAPPNMNDLMVDITEIEAKIGNMVTLLGRDGDDEIKISELANNLETIEAEILCLMDKTKDRVYNYQ